MLNPIQKRIVSPYAPAVGSCAGGSAHDDAVQLDQVRGDQTLLRAAPEVATLFPGGAATDGESHHGLGARLLGVSLAISAGLGSAGLILPPALEAAQEAPIAQTFRPPAEHLRDTVAQDSTGLSQRGHNHSHPPVIAQKGDYVIHWINFSHLLTDEEFTDADALDQAKIQALLEKNGSFLAHYALHGRPAARIISEAAKKHQINPLVIMATLEKENSLISRTSQPSKGVLRRSMGYAYVDGAMYAGGKTDFAYQVDQGTQLLRNLYEEGRRIPMPTSLTVDYGQRVLKVDNSATYALMRYTPHISDTHLQEVGGGNYLFIHIVQRFNRQLARMEGRPA